ncbi:RNA-binding protein 28-like [Dendronephthya gigantea]|uniref:RNA-binding protein 28-like n=1 Tax=Dendronephthya gigantea TaxID=151771 RepID=UPI00106C6487|nr:RNA-binding protein 28-like [Dendronephthya gigantea]
MATAEGAKITKDTTLSSTTLFVRNLPFSFDNKELENVFSEVGPVKRCFVVKDKANPNKCRGFGYVTFALKEDALQAQEKVRQINGRKLFITFSNKKPRHVERGPPKIKQNDAVEGETTEDHEETHKNVPTEPDPSQEIDKPKHKPKSKRSSALNDDGRTVVITGFPSTFNIKQLKKACKRNGEVERFIYPADSDSKTTAHAVYKSHKDARKAVSILNGKTVKGEVLNAVLRSKQEKTFSQKTLKKSRLIVRNLPFKCSQELLADEFSKFGEISEIVLPTKIVGKKKKKLGFAFVQFKNVFDAGKALQGMNKKEIKGRPIAVDWTLPKKKYELLKVSEEKDDVKEMKDDVMSGESSDDDGTGGNKDSGDENGTDGDDHGTDGDDDGTDADDSGTDADDSGTDGDDDGTDGDDDGTDGDDDGTDSDDNGTSGESTDNDDEGAIVKKRKLRDAREGKTIFIRNLPFDANEEEICGLFEELGEIAYCKIVVDSVTDHSRGCAFVKFEKKQSAEECLEKYGEENEVSEELILRKRPLSVTLAVTKGKVSQLLADKDATKKGPRDKRNLYLAKEGVITPGTEAAVGLSKSDLQKRQKALEEKNAKLKIPHYIVSKTRLCFRNLPLHIDNKKLSEVLRTVCEGKPKTVQKVQIMRNMDRLDSSGVGRSKGFGFVEFLSHQAALDVLRATNNNPEIFGPDRRPIVEFAIENSLILKRLELRKTKNAKKIGPRETSRGQDTEQNKRKHEIEENGKRKRVKKNATNVDSSNANSNKQLEQNRNAFKGDSFKNKPGRNKAKSKVLGSETKKHFASRERNENRNARVDYDGVGSSVKKQKRRGKNDQDEVKFNQIVEKYKTKLFGKNIKQLKDSRWFDA